MTKMSRLIKAVRDAQNALHLRNYPPMKCHRWIVAGCLLISFAEAQTLQETWQTGYENEDAQGSHVLGYWKFDGDEPLKDHSRAANGLSLVGAKIRPSGKFGGCVESFPGYPVQDQRHAVLSSPEAKLSPKGALTLEMWIKPKPDWNAQTRVYLLDKKYVDHTDYAWQISEASSTGTRRLIVTLGFGHESKVLESESIRLSSEWQHVAFVYDGQGTGHFYHQGQPIGSVSLKGYHAIAPGKRPLSLGDRLGSHYGGFPGWMDEVRISDRALFFEPVKLEFFSSRKVWRRMEERVKPIEIHCTNLSHTRLEGASLEVSLDRTQQAFPLPDLKAGETHVVKVAPNTELKPGKYRWKATLKSSATVQKRSMDVEIVPRHPPQLPIVMWGAGGDEMQRLKDIGFTHFIGMGDQGAADLWREKKERPPGDDATILGHRQMLDEALRNGLGVIANVSPGDVLRSNPAHLRVDRSGKPYERQDLCASLPEFAPYFQSVGQSLAKAYGDYPAFAAALVNTEVRDHNAPSFNAVDVANYRKLFGTDIPAEVKHKWGVSYSALPDFPADRVIPDTHPILNYYRWFWTVGDGWNGLHYALHKGLKSHGRRDFWTFFDPAVRQPSIGGAGGGVDVLSHWTYTYPDPQRIGLATDQLLAMSEVNGRRQSIMKMTQLIWYRSQTAPTQSPPLPNPVAWEDHDPEAAYITLAPMHLREAFWTKLSRPVQGIMYHGWQSLVECPESSSAYRFTNPHTAPVLRDLIREVAVPLGPTLMKVPGERREVAMLESFTSQMFARRGGYGSNLGWSSDLWQALQHAHVQLDVVFEEAVAKGALKGRKILIMPECDVLTQGMVKRIAEWQKHGGKIIADEFLCPALKADVILPSFKRVKRAAEDKAAVLALAAQLPEKMKALGWKPTFEIDQAEIILQSRPSGEATYLFAINDRREAGSYVGHHGLVLENGLPTTGLLQINLENANLYDLTRHSLVLPRRNEEGTLTLPLELGPGEGRLWMILPKPLLQLAVDLPATATCGNIAKITAMLTLTDETPAPGHVPLEVEIQDANGVRAEGSGWYAMEKGRLELSLDLATNEDPGTWQVRVRELASGMEVTKWMQVSAK